MGSLGPMTGRDCSMRWNGRPRLSSPMSMERSLSWKKSVAFQKSSEVSSDSFVFYCEAAEAAGSLFIFT
ncbi:hypothetical protein NITLEN_40063 [Nitrospira lenta]|uniref:Uncharacterized protein n=1 Tax=Nitrospira lenta TaxID=1436998 RepID=A0A330L6Q1_9BACT|nr:hypothetical protein NITLEN_40063 [Nitrospira lenta]